MKQISTLQKARYAFDNTMSKGPIALIAWLAVVSLLVILVAAAIVFTFGIMPEDDEEPTAAAPAVQQVDGAAKPQAAEEPERLPPHEAFWMALMRTLDP